MKNPPSFLFLLLFFSNNHNPGNIPLVFVFCPDVDIPISPSSCHDPVQVFDRRQVGAGGVKRCPRAPFTAADRLKASRRDLRAFCVWLKQPVHFECLIRPCPPGRTFYHPLVNPNLSEVPQTLLILTVRPSS